MKRRWFGKRSVVVGAVVALACSALAACGGGSSSGDTGNDAAKEKNVTINVGILPITSVGALMLGIDKGFFKDEGITIKTNVAQSGAALVPAIVSGQYQFAFSNNLSLIIAAGKNLPVRIVRTANSADSDPTPSQEALFVSKNSPIKALKDLQGKTVAVNSLNNTPHLAVLTTLENAGVDTKTVKFVEVGFPDMPLALELGRVDAADISEPFVTKATDEGMKDMAHPYRVLAQDLPLSSWFTTQSYIDTNKDVVKRFARAVDKSNTYAQAHVEEVRSFIPTYLKVDLDLAKRMAMPRYPEGTPSQEILQKLAQGAAHFGFVKTPATAEQLKSLVANIG